MADRTDEELLSTADSFMQQKLSGAPTEQMLGLQSDLERAIFKRLALRLIRDRVNAPATFFAGNAREQEKPAVGLTWQEPGKAQISVLAVHGSPFVAIRDLYHAIDRVLPAKEPPCAPTPATTPEPPSPTSSPEPLRASVSAGGRKRRSSARGETKSGKSAQSGSRKVPSTKARKSRAKATKAR